MAGNATVSTEVSVWRTEGFPVDADRILRVQGYRDPARIRPRIRKIAERAAADIATIGTPEARFVRSGIESISNGVLTLSGGHEFNCAAFDRLLANATDVVVFVMTLGPGVDVATAQRFEASEPVESRAIEFVAS